MARFQNTSPEPFLHVFETSYRVDNRLIGVAEMPEIPAGTEALLAFGPLEDLRLERLVLQRRDADSGIITRSNTRDEEVRITVQNLGARSWPVELLDRIPFSEQEDLIITYAASPDPDVENVDDRRGVLQWDFEMSPGSEKQISLDLGIRWPEDKILR